MNSSVTWYGRYPELVSEVSERRNEFFARCKALGAKPGAVFGEVWVELVARAVKESNWQEGLKLDADRTQELAAEAIEQHRQNKGLRLDTEKLLAEHKKSVQRLKRRSASPEEIGAFNLSSAYNAIPMVGRELNARSTASLGKAVREAQQSLEKLPNVPADLRTKMENAISIVDQLCKRDQPLKLPLDVTIATVGEHFSKLLEEDIASLLNPMTDEYIHFLHRITLMGLYPSNLCGRYRRIPVHVGREDVMFPAPSLVPGLMHEYCNSFPSLLSEVTKYDPIKMAAKISHRFASIHPYRDGNGRVSRLLMNLVLWAHHHPPVYLKADKKGRHRYSLALRHANRGDFVPLASLIAISLEEIYVRLASTVKSQN